MSWKQDFWDGKALLEEANAAGAEVAMVFNYRFFDQTVRGRQIVDDRDLGAPVECHGAFPLRHLEPLHRFDTSVCRSGPANLRPAGHSGP